MQPRSIVELQRSSDLGAFLRRPQTHSQVLPGERRLPFHHLAPHLLQRGLVAGLDAGEEGLDAEHEAATAALDDIEERLAKARDEAQQADRDRGALAARKDALELGLNRKDGAGALLAANDQVSGLLGSVAALLTVRTGYEAAIAQALGAAADAVAVADAEAAPGVLAVVTAGNAGRLGKGRMNVATLLGGPEIEHYHQAVALVVAETFEQARAAAQRIRVEYAPEQGRFDLAEEAKAARRRVGTAMKAVPDRRRTGSAISRPPSRRRP